MPRDGSVRNPSVESVCRGTHGGGITQGFREALQNQPRKGHGPAGAFLEEKAPDFPCICPRGQRIQRGPHP